MAARVKRAGSTPPVTPRDTKAEAAPRPGPLHRNLGEVDKAHPVRNSLLPDDLPVKKSFVILYTIGRRFAAIRNPRKELRYRAKKMPCRISLARRSLISFPSPHQEKPQAFPPRGSSRCSYNGTCTYTYIFRKRSDRWPASD